MTPWNCSKGTKRSFCKYPELLRQRETRCLEINPRGMTIIPESDMYRLVIHSKLASAEKFERWVMEGVLPMIRKTGGTYMTAEAALEVIKDPRYVMGVMELIKRQYIENGRLVETIEIKRCSRRGSSFTSIRKRQGWRGHVSPVPTPSQ